MSEPVAIPVTVWRLDLDAPLPAADATTPEEQARADALTDPRARRRYRAARAWLRILLARVLDLPPHVLSFSATPRGKPELPGHPVRFNLTHAGGRGLLAILPGDIPVGIDLERIDRHRNAIAIAGRFFAPEEAAALCALPEADRAGAFVRMWTRKEAFVKAVGTGIAGTFDAFEVAADNAPPLLRASRIDGEPADAWTLMDLDAFPGHAAALAVRAGAAEVVLRDAPARYGRYEDRAVNRSAGIRPARIDIDAEK